MTEPNVTTGAAIGAPPLERDPLVREKVARIVGPADARTLLAAETAANLVKTYNLLHDALNAALGPLDLSLAKLNLLVLLRDSESEAGSMCQLSQRMSVTPTNVTRLVDGLEKAGLVRRIRQRSDRRVLHVELSERGRSRLDAGLAEYREAVRRVCGTLDDTDCFAMISLMTRFRTNLLAAASPAPPAKPARKAVHATGSAQ
ncbi:MAG: MarR family transcriptional regulator [Armatimonadetes bacterium]|nr:MarR family transcriptional regulator [Armatimonadota bacterium]MDE2206243.1 MarR family transcriptional regulator [Armatimonadota bacterium]